MKIAINHLTRMHSGYICAAGIDLDSGRHVRPMLKLGKRCGVDLLACRGGLFDIACIVDIGDVKPTPKPPEIEDHLFNPSNAKFCGKIDSVTFWRQLNKVARNSLKEIFGPDLRGSGNSAVVDLRKGSASLGCLMPGKPVKLYVRPKKQGPGSIRMKLAEGDFDLDISVTDLRLYDRDFNPDFRHVRKLADRLKNSAGVILAVGLTRPFAKDVDTPPLHWLQINNIHLLENPTWRVADFTNW